MKRPEHSASDIASQDQRLSTLMRAANAFEALDQRIQPILSERARGQVRVACVDGDTLVLSAASAAWATLARLEADTCLQAARAIWPAALVAVKVIVQKPAA